MKKERLEKVLEGMKKRGVSQMIISDPSSIFYLTGKWFFPGERMLVLYINTRGGLKLFINKLFPLCEDIGTENVWFTDDDDSARVLSEHIEDGNTIGIDKNWPARFLLRLQGLKKGCAFINGSPIVDEARSLKDQEEKELMRESSQVNDAVMDKIIKGIDKSRTEKEIAEGLLGIYRENGAEAYSFDPIIAYGKNAADPHHESDSSILMEGDSIIIDIGCKKNSYCSDMTRTVFYKKASEKARDVYNTVLEANMRAINTVKPGVRFCDIDGAAREYIESKGYGMYFTHRTGHSIGVDDHEYGDVSSVNTDEVKEGMIFSIEPGIYIQGEVGVRIEDLVLVTEDGCEVLNKYNKELTIID